MASFNNSSAVKFLALFCIPGLLFASGSFDVATSSFIQDQTNGYEPFQAVNSKLRKFLRKNTFFKTSTKKFLFKTTTDQSQRLKLMYGINEATIIASLAIPSGLFIGFSTILLNRLRQCL